MGGEMALTDTFIKAAKPNGKTYVKCTDGDGMYVLVTSAGKYWRMDYRLLGKRKTLALGIPRDHSGQSAEPLQRGQGDARGRPGPGRREAESEASKAGQGCSDFRTGRRLVAAKDCVKQGSHDAGEGARLPQGAPGHIRRVV